MDLVFFGDRDGVCVCDKGISSSLSSSVKSEKYASSSMSGTLSGEVAERVRAGERREQEGHARLGLPHLDPRRQRARARATSLPTTMFSTPATSSSRQGSSLLRSTATKRDTLAAELERGQ